MKLKSRYGIGEFTYTLNATVLLLSFFTLSQGQNLLAVLDLQGDGTIPQEDIRKASDRISEALREDSAYFQFDRSHLPDLLSQLSIEQSATGCSDPQCLTVIGSLIGANSVIGGMIRKEGRRTEVSLNLVDVATRKAVNSVDLSSRAPMSEVIATEIPALTKVLMSGPVSTAAGKKSHKNFFSNPVTYISAAALIGGAATGGYYFYKHYYRDGDSDGTGIRTAEISIDDAPVRTRE